MSNMMPQRSVVSNLLVIILNGFQIVDSIEEIKE
jgi:hypothetical protein